MNETEREIPGEKWDGIEESKLMPCRIVDLEFKDLIYIKCVRVFCEDYRTHSAPGGVVLPVV